MLRILFVSFLLNGIFLATVNAADFVKSTLEDQTSVEVTVYNSNIALIKDTRSLKLTQGEGELRFMDVSAHIMPVTVHAKSLNHPNKFMIIEQNYEYDLMDPRKVLDKFVGKKIRIMDQNRYQDRKDFVDAVLLSNLNHNQIYQINDEIYLGHPGIPVLPEIPENLIAQPTLMWLYQNDSTSEHALEVSYLTNSMTWKADYILVVNHNDTQADLSGWVTVDNNSGATYTNASLKLVAGEVNRAKSHASDVDQMFAMEMVSSRRNAAPQFQEKGFFEYHIYDLQRTTTLKNKQMKQINLLEASGVEIDKEFVVFGHRTYYNRQYREKLPKQPVNVHIKFKNKKENELGMPLPKGIIRLYKKDDEQKLQFVGEDNIEHTPKNEEVSLKVGEAFDVIAERKQTDFRQVTSQMHESAWEITLRNHKEEDIVVNLLEPIHGNWSMISNSHTYTKEGAFTVRFAVKVPKDQEVKVTYRVRVGI